MSTAQPPLKEPPQLLDAWLKIASAFERSGLLLLAFDLHGRVELFNRGCEEASGLTFADVRGKPFWDTLIQTPEIAQVMQALLAQISQDTSLLPPSYAMTFTPAGRAPIRLLWSLSLLTDDDGVVRHIAAIGQNISDLAELEQRATESEELNRVVLDQAPVGVAVYRSGGECLQVNATCAHIAGCAPADLLKQNFRELPSWKNTGLLETAEAVLADGQPRSIEVHTTSAFGREIWVYCRLAVIQIKGESHLLNVSDDLLARRKAEDGLRRAEMRFHSLVEHIPAIIYTAALDEDNTPVFYSPQTQPILGYSPDEMTAHPYAWLQKIHPADRERVQEELKRCSHDEQGFHAEYRMIRRDGREIWIRDDASVVAGPNGEKLYLQGIMVDITAEHQVEERLSDYAARQATLAEIARQMSESISDLPRLLDLVARRIVELLGDYCIIFLARPGSPFLETAAIYHADPRLREKLRVNLAECPFRLGEYAAGQTAQTGEEIILNVIDATRAPENIREASIMMLKELSIHSVMILPMRTRNEITGVITVMRSETPEPYTGADQEYLRILCNRGGLAIANARLYAENSRQKEELELRVQERTAELRQSEDFFRATLNAFSEPALLLAPDGLILSANEATARRLSTPLDHLIKKTIYHFMADDVAEQRKKEVQVALETGRPHEYEELRHGRHELTRLYPVFGPGGMVTALAVLIIDVTASREMERELFTSRQHLRTVLDTIPQRVFWKTPDLRFLGANRAFCEDVARQPDELVGLTDFDLAPNDLAAEYRAAEQALLATGQSRLGSEEMVRTADGRLLYVRTSRSPLRGPNGEMIGILGIYEDVSTERLMQAELLASEDRYRTAFEQAPLGIAHLTAEGRFLRVNYSLTQILGYSQAELFEMTFLQITHPDDVAELAAGIQRALQGEIKDFSIEKRYLGKDGRVVWTHTTISLLRSPEGAPLYLVAIIENISARIAAQNMLEERTRDLARSNADLEKFAYAVSHDLQEPLRMVSSFSQLLARRYEGRLDADADEYIHYVIDGAQYMQRLINSLLAYSRVGTRGQPFTTVDMQSVFQQTCHNLQIAIDEAHAQVHADELPKICADESQMGQLLQNLIGNAIKFRGEGIPNIQVSAQRENDAWRFCVRDNGIGVEAEYFERIFLIFQRLHTRDQYPGTGIGLAICKKIVERHGGRIWLESQPGSGSTFYFTIPDR